MEDVKTYVLRCKSCGGTLEPTDDEDVLVCPYCGSREIIEESDAVKIEKMRAEAELERQKILAEGRTVKKRRSGKNLFLIGAIILLLISLTGCLMAFTNGARYSGAISIIQIVFVILALVACYKTAKPKFKKLHVAFLVIAAILIIPYLSFLVYDSSSYGYSHSTEDIDWDSLTLSSVLPRPENNTGRVYTDSSERLSCDITPYTLAQFKDYVSACKEAGYTVDIVAPNERSFKAYNEQGYCVDLYCYNSNEYMSLNLDAPIQMSEFIWPTHGLAALLPAPSSGIGKIEGDSNDYFRAYVGETTKDEYARYVAAVMDAGFDNDYYRNDTSFGGKNADGVRVSIDFEGNKIMSVRISDYK